jgi:hypothetical protein
MSVEQNLNPFRDAPVAAAPATGAVMVQAAAAVANVREMIAAATDRPRKEVVAFDRIVDAFTRLGLAEAGTYQYARGGQDISGLSIRAAEAIAQRWGNMRTGVIELTRHNGVSECLAFAHDLETNYRDEKQFQVRHWRETKKGGYPITDDRDIYELVANVGARRKRACILAVIPSDVQEAVLRQIEVTLKTTIEVTPELIKSLIEKFAAFGVTQGQLEKRIQRRIDTITPALVYNLGKIYNSLKDGMSQPGDWFESEAQTGGEQAAPEPKGTAESVKAKLKAKTAAKPESDAIPIYTAATAIKAFMAAQSEDALNGVWNDVVADFKETNRPLPVEVEAAYNDRIESFMND